MGDSEAAGQWQTASVMPVGKEKACVGEPECGYYRRSLGSGGAELELNSSRDSGTRPKLGGKSERVFILSATGKVLFSV